MPNLFSFSFVFISFISLYDSTLRVHVLVFVEGCSAWSKHVLHKSAQHIDVLGSRVQGSHFVCTDVLQGVLLSALMYIMVTFVCTDVLQGVLLSALMYIMITFVYTDVLQGVLLSALMYFRVYFCLHLTT